MIDSVLPVSALPAELQQRIFSLLPPDLQTLCLQGHILVTDSRVVSLPSGTAVRVFIVGQGGHGVSFRFTASIDM